MHVKISQKSKNLVIEIKNFSLVGITSLLLLLLTCCDMTCDFWQAAT
jgi:hypothetical protein